MSWLKTALTALKETKLLKAAGGLFSKGVAGVPGSVSIAGVVPAVEPVAPGLFRRLGTSATELVKRNPGKTAAVGMGAAYMYGGNKGESYGRDVGYKEGLREGVETGKKEAESELAAAPGANSEPAPTGYLSRVWSALVDLLKSVFGGSKKQPPQTVASAPVNPGAQAQPMAVVPPSGLPLQPSAVPQR